MTLDFLCAHLNFLLPSSWNARTLLKGVLCPALFSKTMPYYDYVDDKRTFQRGIFSLFAVILAGLCFSNPGGIFRSEQKYQPPSRDRQWPRNRRSLSESDSSSSSSQSSLEDLPSPRRAHHSTSSRDGARARYSYPQDQDYTLHTHHHHSHHQNHNSHSPTLSRRDDPFAWENALKGV